MARSIPDSRWATAKSPVATAPAGGGARVLERLVLVLPILLLPHVGSATVETRRAMGDLTVENLVRYFTDGTVTSPVPECAAIAKTG